MPNPFNVMKSVFPDLSNIKNVYKAMSQSQNPYEMFLKLAGNNPQLQPIVQAMQNGGNPQQIFNQICQQRGINPNEFIKSITG